MSHGKVLSQGNVPFSWEDKPGVSKFIYPNCPTDIVLNSPKFSPQPTDTPTMVAHEKKIIPPPPSMIQPPRRSTSTKGLWEQDDPFLKAFKECTKNGTNAEKAGESKSGFVFKVQKCRFLFSCKHSCDVRDDTLVRLSNLPPLPRERYGGLTKIRK